MKNALLTFISTRFAVFVILVAATTFLGTTGRLNSDDIAMIFMSSAVGFFGTKGIEWYHRGNKNNTPQ